VNAFKTLAEARSAFEALEAETVELRGKANEIPQITAQLAEAKAFLADATTENENFRLLIVQKDTEIGTKTVQIEGLQTEISGLKTQVSELEKGQKTAKQHARELVAATGGTPVSVDQSEINKMQAGSEAEMAKAMLAEHDPVRLGQLYEEYNRLYRKPKNKK
jgi:predicted  nucleic acid-binding Zn-ribbon protein